MAESIRIGDKVRIYLDSKFGDKEGWYQGVVFQIDPYSEHRSFYWVELNEDAQSALGIRQISIFNPKNIKLDSKI
jgi:multidrug resistance efflux pump